MTTIYPNQEVFVNKSVPDQNQHGTGILGCFTTGGVVTYISLCQWDISAINVDTLTGATFYFQTDDETIDESPWNANYTFRRLTSTFVDTTVTWNTQPTWTTTNFATESHSESGGTDTWHSVDILSMMQDETGSTFGLQFFLSIGGVATIFRNTYISYTGGEFPMRINIGDSWKNATAMKINIGDAWKDVVSVKQNIGDTWKTVF